MRERNDWTKVCFPFGNLQKKTSIVFCNKSLCTTYLENLFLSFPLSSRLYISSRGELKTSLLEKRYHRILNGYTEVDRLQLICIESNLMLHPMHSH